MSEHRDRLPTGTEVGRAVLLPGRGYTPAKPALATLVDLLLARGWAVREVWWRPPAEERSPRWWRSWVADQARTAADGWHERPLVVGKSLGSLAAPYAATNRLDAVWLTPLLHDKGVVRGIRRSRCRQLLVGGTADPSWDGAVAGSLRTDVLQLEGADHSLTVKGERELTADALDRLQDAVAAWLP